VRIFAFDESRDLHRSHFGHDDRGSNDPSCSNPWPRLRQLIQPPQSWHLIYGVTAGDDLGNDSGGLWRVVGQVDEIKHRIAIRGQLRVVDAESLCRSLPEQCLRGLR
jgi:hypothetical protein